MASAARNVRKSRRIRERVSPAQKLAREILPAIQARRGDYVMVDVKNHSEADQRHSVRSGQTTTLMRKPKLFKLYDAKAIDKGQLTACQWYRDTHAAGFETVGITADYGREGGGAVCVATHLAKHREQMVARSEYAAARASISPMLIHLFERVVLNDRPVGRLGVSFRMAISQLQRHLNERGLGA